MGDIYNLPITPRETAGAPVDLRELFPELWGRKAPSGALLDRGLRPMPPAEAAAFLADQVELWRVHRSFTLRRLAGTLHPQDRVRLRERARLYRDFLDRAERLLAEWAPAKL